MAETFTLSELVVPGTYVRVSAEGLIGAAGISTGNIGIVGTALVVDAETHILGDYRTASEEFGPYDEFNAGAGTLNLSRALEVAYRNGARTVFARSLDAGANQ